MSRRVAGLLLIVVATGACANLPEDHVLRQQWAQKQRNLSRHLNPSRHLEDASRRLANLRSTATELAPWEHAARARLARLPKHSKDLLETEFRRGRQASQSATDLLQMEFDSARSLQHPNAAWRRIVSPDEAARRINRAADRVPTLLDLDRQPLPSATDPGRQTTLEPVGRRETWVERVLRRIPW